jgi:hypothetical protein
MRGSAEWIRRRIQYEPHAAEAFREAFFAIAPAERDAWLDAVLGLGDMPDDGPEVPRGCVPYLPSPVEALLRMVDRAGVTSSDVFVDIGAGLGRTTAFVHLLTGAEALGIEIQSGLVRTARALAAALGLSRIAYCEGDAATSIQSVSTGSVFFLYCPFSGDRLTNVLGGLEVISRGRAIRVCCLDLPLPPCPWLMPEAQPDRDLTIYRSVTATLA